jgi:hypothetical protein
MSAHGGSRTAGVPDAPAGPSNTTSPIGVNDITCIITCTITCIRTCTLSR